MVVVRILDNADYKYRYLELIRKKMTLRYCVKAHQLKMGGLLLYAIFTLSSRGLK